MAKVETMFTLWRRYGSYVCMYDLHVCVYMCVCLCIYGYV